MKYEIVAANSVVALEKMVEKNLKKGWHLWFGLVVEPGVCNETAEWPATLYQVMVKQ